MVPIIFLIAHDSSTPTVVLSSYLNCDNVLFIVPVSFHTSLALIILTVKLTIRFKPKQDIAHLPGLSVLSSAILVSIQMGMVTQVCLVTIVAVVLEHERHSLNIHTFPKVFNSLYILANIFVFLGTLTTLFVVWELIIAMIMVMMMVPMMIIMVVMIIVRIIMVAMIMIMVAMNEESVRIFWN